MVGFVRNQIDADNLLQRESSFRDSASIILIEFPQSEEMR